MLSLRKSDSKTEQAVADFLDSHFYQKNVADFERFTAPEEQLKGKDVTFSWKSMNRIIVDEKSQGHYINKNLPTFAFEVDFLRQGGILTPGWLFDTDKETEYYLLIWITAKTDKNISAEDIRQLDCMLIKREDIILFLFERGITPDKAKEISKKMRDLNMQKKNEEDKFEGFYFYRSTHLAEKPVNIVIRKNILENLATDIFQVKI